MYCCDLQLTCLDPHIILVCFYSPVQVRVYEITEPLKQTRLSLQETVKELRWQLTARETEIQSTHQVYTYIHYTHVHTHTHVLSYVELTTLLMHVYTCMCIYILEIHTHTHTHIFNSLSICLLHKCHSRHLGSLHGYYTCIYIYIHVHTCVYMCIHVYTCVYVCLYIYTHTCIYMSRVVSFTYDVYMYCMSIS